MNASDELAGIISDHHVWNGDEGCSGKEAAADAILAAGYRKPRTITTAEELDTLADGATLLDRHGDAYQLAGEFWRLAGFGDDFGAHEIDLPATVLHEPEASA